MLIDKLVINASPLILLYKADLDYLLPELFSQIVIPNSVWNEVRAGDDAASVKAEYAPWLNRVSIEMNEEILAWNLGDGESEVLSYAVANPGFRAGIDDRAARKCALTLRIPVLGTGGMLLLAKRRRILGSVSDSLSRLQDSGLFISEEIIKKLTSEAGE